MEDRNEILSWLGEFPVGTTNLITSIVITLVIMLLAFGIWIVISKSLSVLEARSRLSKRQTFPLRLFFRYGTIVVTLMLILTANGVPIGNFWTFVSALLGLVAIGFVAVWSMLSNISATLLLIGFKPFSVGDTIRIVGDDVEGEVVDMDFMFTKIRRKDGDLFSIPNNQFFQKAIVKPVAKEVEEGTPY